MPGGLMQLVSYGSEDLYLTGSPSMTFFKLVYRRHTNFSNEYIDQYFFSLPNFTTTQHTLSKIIIERNADLLGDCYLVYDLPNIISDDEEQFRWVRNIGHRLVHTIEFTLDGQRIDIHYGQWLNIWSELTVPNSKKQAYKRMVGDFHKLRPGFGPFYPDRKNGITIPRTRLYIPLEFSFCKNPGLFLPLIALQYNRVMIYVDFNPLNDLFTIGKERLSPSAFFSQANCENDLYKKLTAEGYDATNIFWKFVNGCSNISSWTQNSFMIANYIYLDEDERRNFAATSHEYLIEQVQHRLFTGLHQGVNRIELDIRHPVKEIIWTIQKYDISVLNNWFNYTFIDMNNDYTEIKKEYGDKFDFLNHPEDVAFYSATDTNFISSIEDTGTKALEMQKLVNGINHSAIFNDYYNIMVSAKLIFNGHDRFKEQDHTFFQDLQSYQYHTHSAPHGVYLYSFAINPEDMQPSGTANFSRLSTAEIEVVLRRDKLDDNGANCENDKPLDYNMYFYARNYNILRIMGGIGQLAFAS